MTLTKIASEVGVHPVHLAATFRQKYGCTVGEFVRLLKIERARNDLGNLDLSVEQIAAQAGFADQSHFSKTFKDYTGLTPTEYRREFFNSSKRKMIPQSTTE